MTVLEHGRAARQINELRAALALAERASEAVTAAGAWLHLTSDGRYDSLSANVYAGPDLCDWPAILAGMRALAAALNVRPEVAYDTGDIVGLTVRTTLAGFPVEVDARVKTPDVTHAARQWLATDAARPAGEAA